MKSSPVNIFIFCYNEAILLPQTIKHYKTMLPSSILTLCDNESTDNSVKIAKDLGCKIITWSSGNHANILKKKKISNTCWNHLKKGWVIVCDMDEWLCVTEKDLLEEESKGTTLLSIEGYNITGKSKNIDLNDVNLHSLNSGYFHKYESKNLCFHLPEIKEMNYGPGAHHSNPKGNIKYSSTYYINKHLNEPGLPYLINKMKKRFIRTRKMRKLGYSKHYTNDLAKIKKNYNNALNKSIKLRCNVKGYCFTRKVRK